MALIDIAARSIAFALSLIELVYVVLSKMIKPWDTVSIDPEEAVIWYEIKFVWEKISFTAHALR